MLVAGLLNVCSEQTAEFVCFLFILLKYDGNLDLIFDLNTFNCNLQTFTITRRGGDGRRLLISSGPISGVQAPQVAA